MVCGQRHWTDERREYRRKSAARVEFVTPRCHQQAAILREEEARRADDSGGGELNRTAFISLRVVHVGKRVNERDPQLPAAVDGRISNA